MDTKPALTEKPCLIETGQGFSVFYNNRYLYSRYAPSASIQKIVDGANIPPESLVFCLSPLLGYGLAGLLLKLPQSCTVVCLEADRALYEFSLEYLSPVLAQNPRLTYRHLASAADFIAFMTQGSGRPNLAKFRRCVFLEFSGGAQLRVDLYTAVKQLADDFISSYWKNRLTMVKLGRLFSRNLLRNLSGLPFADFLMRESVQKPLLVVGAGPSTDTTLRQLCESDNGKRFFILAVDSALMPLLSRGIQPSAVIALESQLANEKAFTAAAGCAVPLIADITSRPSVLRICGGPVAFICSRYVDAFFFDKIMPLAAGIPVFPPLGSVGLAALETALYLRASAAVPVFFTGLDFSFTAGKTHCREAPALRYALNTHNRLTCLENPAAAFSEGSFKITAKDGKTASSFPALAGYGKLLGARYAGAANVFDISVSGMDTGCARLRADQAMDLADDLAQAAETGTKKNPQNSGGRFYRRLTQAEKAELEQSIADFYRKEKAALENLQNMLSSGSGSLEEITAAITCREYLFLHFADGHLGVQTNTAFLKRIRSETDFFLKDLQLGAAGRGAR